MNRRSAEISSLSTTDVVDRNVAIREQGDHQGCKRGGRMKKNLSNAERHWPSSSLSIYASLSRHSPSARVQGERVNLRRAEKKPRSRPQVCFRLVFSTRNFPPDVANGVVSHDEATTDSFVVKVSPAWRDRSTRTTRDLERSSLARFTHVLTPEHVWHAKPRNSSQFVITSLMLTAPLRVGRKDGKLKTKRGEGGGRSWEPPWTFWTGSDTVPPGGRTSKFAIRTSFVSHFLSSAQPRAKRETEEVSLFR